jgi:mono/diheme cytochrome c family protein
VAAWLGRGRADVRVIPVREPRLEYAIGAGVRRRDAGLPAAVDAAIGRLGDSGKVRDVLQRYGVAGELRGAGEPPAPGPGGRLARAAAPAVDHGRSLFSTACSRCHGAEGVGGGEGGAIPPIRKYEGGWEKFQRIVRDGRKNTAMAPFKGILTDDEIRAIYAYLTSLQ